MNRASGMTLLEVLLAATLLAGVAIAIGTWTRLVARSSRQIGELHAAERISSAALRLLRADLEGMVGIGHELGERGHRLSVRTINRLPGQSHDVRSIAWICEDRMLARSETGSDAPALRFTMDLAGLTFENGSDGQVWLRGDRQADAAGGAQDPAGIVVWRSWNR